MNRRGFFRLPLAAAIGGAPVAALDAKPVEDTRVPKVGDIVSPPAGALEVTIEGKTYHLYLFEPKS